MTKKCSKCNIEKDICEFNSDNRPHAKFGKRPECRSCGKKIRDKYVNNSEIKSKIKKNYKDYVSRNKHKINIRRNKWFKEKTKNDILFRLSRNLRNRIYKFVKNKSKRTEEIIGIDYEGLEKYLESKFLIGMSWDNYGEWQIDHIIPISSGKDENEIYELCKYNNLQPLWKLDNIKKSNKIMVEVAQKPKGFLVEQSSEQRCDSGSNPLPTTGQSV